MSSPRRTSIELEQDCEVILIPGGQKMTLPAGQQLVVVQALGGTFTVQIDSGHLARISSEDAYAIGLDDEPISVDPPSSAPFELDRVIEQLRTVYDPEIPINVVDLGLIYGCDAHLLADGSHRVGIKMSMTAPGCGMGDVLKDDARSRVQTVPGVSEVEVELVWDPPWDQSRLSDAARLELGLY